jgi:hypothetical protein
MGNIATAKRYNLSVIDIKARAITKGEKNLSLSSNNKQEMVEI